MPRKKPGKPMRQQRSAVTAHARSRYKHSLRLRKSGKAEMQGKAKLGELEHRASEAGYLAAFRHAECSLSYEHLQSSYWEWFREALDTKLSWRSILSISMAYRHGYNMIAKQPMLGIPLPIRGTVTAVVSASNEEKTVAAVISELCRLPIREIIVILNGCKDSSFQSIERNERVTVISYPKRLGHDVSRGIGASLATGDVVLFTDGDIVLAAEDLVSFLLEIDKGTDVALNDISPYLPPFSKQDAVTRSKMFLNHMLGRPDLKANSLTAVPHAISRRAISVLGAQSFIVPPKAQALAIAQGLAIRAPQSVDVVRKNRIRSGNVGAGNEVAQLILGDHIEALEAVMGLQGSRLKMTRLPRSELARRRNRR